MSTIRRNPFIFYSIMCLFVYAIGVTVFTVWRNNQAKKDILTDIDHRLVLAAECLPYLLAPDFHDRAVNRTSISFEEEMKNRNAVSGLAFETDFQWLYTLLEKDGKFYFSAPTVTEEEGRQQKRWYFHPYDDVPVEFVQAYKENKPVFTEYTDHWGSFRSVALPRTSPAGHRYLSCADYSIDFVDGLLTQKFWQSILTALFFLLLGVPFVLVFVCYSGELKRINQALISHRDQLEKKVEERTADLRKAKEKAEHLATSLGKTLEEIKTLRGLLPICSKCKNIRDDKGYWHKVEAYIMDRTEAQFSHGLCPICAKELYPGIFDKEES